MMRRNLIALAAVVLMTACSPRGALYQVPFAEARQTLVATGLPPLVFGSQPPEVEVRAEGESQVVWIARREGAELFRYVAELSQDGDGATRVQLELIGAQGGAAGDVAKQFADHPQIRDMYLVAMKERIASALEHRQFEISRVYPSMTAATVANMGALQASADEAAAASAKMERENIEKAYRDEAAGRW
jgi:hypothetical protein